jgi:RsiW-degrading membrane proteinase PrsW (M82 family)
VLYNSPLQRTGGKLALAAILIGMFVYAIPSFQKYYLNQPLQMLAGLAITVILYLPTILVLYFLDRREREAKVLFWGTTLSVIFFFGPVASRTIHFVRDLTQLSDWQFVGFVEEPAKILPLVMLLIFARPAINGTRDGLIYGALGGLGFAMLESSAYFALVNYADLGWSSLLTETIGRASFLGTDIHILFAATVGAAIGYGVSTKKRWLGILVIIGVFLLVALTHGQQDHALGKMLGVGGVVVGGTIVAGLAGMPLEQLDQLQGTPWNYLMLSIGSTFGMIGINLINLILLFVAVWKSGDTERRVVREQLKGEPETIITSQEYVGVEAERRLQLRRVPGYPKKVAKAIRSLQNELAFRKEFVQRHRGDLDTDPPIAALKRLIETERANAASLGK